MAIEIVYKNISGDIITLAEAQALNEWYDKIYYKDGEIKRIDEYIGDSSTTGSYYLDIDEDLSTALEAMENQWTSGNFYLDKQFTGKYLIRNWETYKGFEKIHKGKTIYDDKNREIALQLLDLGTSEVLRTEKTYYLERFGRFINVGDVMRFGTIDFNYNSDYHDVKIEVNVNLPGYEHKQYYIKSNRNVLLEPLIAEVFSWENETYYHSAVPFIPKT